MPQDYPVPQPIKAILAERRQTVTGLSAVVGVNANTLGRIINGYVAPWPLLRSRAAEVLELPEGDLFRPISTGDPS